eukprot:scaffold118317_cov20-Tisochrysis_lutea.AAC.2
MLHQVPKQRSKGKWGFHFCHARPLVHSVPVQRQCAKGMLGHALRANAMAAFIRDAWPCTQC